VKVGEDKIHGLLVTITIRPAPGVSEETITKKVKDLVGRYVVHYRLTFEK